MKNDLDTEEAVIKGLCSHQFQKTSDGGFYRCRNNGCYAEVCASGADSCFCGRPLIAEMWKHVRCPSSSYRLPETKK